MIPQTDTTAPVFISERPDYGQQILIDRTYQTQIFQAQDATEQRAQQRIFSKIGIQYHIAALTPPEAFAREIAILKELAAPVVIPLWPYSWPINAQSGVTLTVPALPGNVLASIFKGALPFRPGGWVFIEDDEGEAFYPLVSVNGATGAVVLSGSVPTFVNGIIRPCIIGTRRDGGAELNTFHTDTDETISVDEL